MRRDDDDQGFSLMEVLVAGGLMSVVLAVVLTATIQIYSGANRIDQTSAARDQLDVSFRRLDRELRYAIWTATPGQKDGKWYLEYALPADASSGTPTYPCRQLVLDAGVLTLRSWNLPGDRPGDPVALASGVTTDGGASPFIINAINASAGAIGVGSEYRPMFQQVRIKFSVRDGRVTLPFDNVFTALNIDRNAAEQGNDCGKGQRL